MKKELHVDVLDKGFVKLRDYMGSDLTIVNAARVSFGKRKEKMDKDDIKLIKYLKENEHTSPFRHPTISLHFKAPEVVTRQHYKHVVGIETTSSYMTKDHAWNELSLRYVKVGDYYEPEEWRKQAQNKKQGSQGVVDNQDQVKDDFDTAMKVCFQIYDSLLEKGVATEQARLVLPISVYTEYYWTASFQSIMNFLELRDDNHAQFEIREYAIAVKQIMLDLFPISTRVWLNPEFDVENLVKYLPESI